MLKVYNFFHSIDTQYLLSYPLTTAKVYRPLIYFLFIDETKRLLIPGLIPTLNLTQKRFPSSKHVFIIYLQVTFEKTGWYKIKEKKLGCII